MQSRRLYKGDRKRRRVLPRGKPPPRVRTERSAPLHVEIVTVGRELLRGQTADANATFLAGDLSRRGAVVHRITVVDDQDRAIGNAVTEALERGAGLVVTTGGLGPTADDRTLGAVADALGVPLEIHPHATAIVDDALHRLRTEGHTVHAGMTRAREKMCAIPVGSEPLPNPAGISPGVLARRPGGGQVVCLPGVPREARAVWQEVVGRVKALQTRFARAEREVEAPTADESELRPWLDRLHKEFPRVWIKSHAPGFSKVGKKRGIRVTFEATAPTQHEADIAVDGAVRRLLAMAGAG